MSNELESAVAAPAEAVVEKPAAVRSERAAAVTRPSLLGATGAIVRKELAIYFTTPLAYVLLAFFIFVMGYFFVVNVQRYLEYARSAQAMMQYSPEALDHLNFTDVIFSPLLFNAALIFVFVLPFLTMRLIAEERRQNSIQLLMTAPVGSTGIVLGKFFAASVVVLAAVGLTMTYPLLLNAVAEGGGVEWQTAGTAYLGLFLCGATFVALGLFISSLTDSQIVAGVVTLVILLLLWLVGWAASAGNVEGTAKELAEWASVPNHLTGFMRGIVNLGDVTFFVTVIALCLFLTRTSIERTRW